jgi:glycosyltransferase involved in cell wall biosynthesis
VPPAAAPPVSICVPSFDGATRLGEALASALAQTFGDFELLVVDDASSDGSADVASGFRDPRLRVLRGPDRLGLPGNWNRCLAEARAPLVKFLFQDDLLARDALEKLVSALESRPRASLAFGRREIRYEGPGLDDFPLQGALYTEAVRAFHRSLTGAVSGLELVARAMDDGRSLTINVVGEPSFVLLRREAALAAGGFDAGFRQLADWELWLRLGLDGELAFVDAPLGVFRIHAGSASASHLTPARLAAENAALLRFILESYGPRLTARARWRLALEALTWRRRRWVAAIGEALGRRVRMGPADRAEP